MENLGRDGKPIEAPMPKYGPAELLVRHDACGLCFLRHQSDQRRASNTREFFGTSREIRWCWDTKSR